MRRPAQITLCYVDKCNPIARENRWVTIITMCGQMSGGHVMAQQRKKYTGLGFCRVPGPWRGGFCMGLCHRPSVCPVPIIHTVIWAIGSLVTLFIVEDLGLQLLILPMVLFFLIMVDDDLWAVVSWNGGIPTCRSSQHKRCYRFRWILKNGKRYNFRDSAVTMLYFSTRTTISTIISVMALLLF